MMYVQTILIFCVVTLAGCAGPTSPFGAFNTLFPIKKNSTDTKIEPYTFSDINFYPERQVFHRKQNLQVLIENSKSHINPTLHVYYKDYEITDQFNSSALREKGEHVESKLFIFKDIRFKPGDEDSLKFITKNQFGKVISKKQYLSPYCELHSLDNILSTEKYDPAPMILNSISSWSRSYNFNPGLMTGLIAQESAFNPKAVSWAKAIGLTQITPIAEKELLKYYVFTPRSKKVEKYSAIIIKGLVKTGKLTKEEDWRLNPIKSIRGGLLHLSYIEKYWEKPKQVKLLKKVFPKGEIPISKIILASYNSGPYRVKSGLKSLGKHFLNHRDLSEANKYVLKIQSLCYHFTHGRKI